MTTEQWHVDHTTDDFEARQSASLARALDLLGGPGASEWDRRVIDLDRYPGEPIAYDGDVDGRRADEEAAAYENRSINQAGWAS